LEPWIGCVFRGNHKVHRANTALKQLRLAFLSYLSVFFTTAADLLQVTSDVVETVTFETETWLKFQNETETSSKTPRPRLET